jgi:hypothetical protein
MNQCTPLTALLAMPPLSLLPLELFGRLFEPVGEVARLVCRFRDCDATPQSSYEFEHKLFELLREVGRVIVEWAYNDREPEGPGARDLLPTQLLSAGVWYRRNGRKTANRNVATLFGTITLMRLLYRPVEELVPCIFPLEIRLGLEAGRATPALAERVGRHAARCTQQVVLQALRDDHGVSWSVHLLRKVTASVAEAMSEHRHEAQVAKLLKLLEQAFASRGDRLPVLAVGRDGVFAPIRKIRGFCEAAVATVSVYDRRGGRLGTVYLGRMPEEGQCTLSHQLTLLLRDVLSRWAGALPRLAYVTDAGTQQTAYFKKVLRRMRHPRTGKPGKPGKRLRWEWVLDYYHACQYLTKLAEALFGEAEQGRDAQAWAAKMRHWLKHKPKGIHRVLHSAAALRHRRGPTITAAAAGAYQKAYHYLSRRIGQLDYHGYRRLRLPIGSGVTEACCKTVFTQRLKQSGMSWDIEGGQAIVDLRVADLSGTWEAMRDARLRSKGVHTLPTRPKNHRKHSEKAA